MNKPLQEILLVEIGQGVDLHGADTAKAARRAVTDAVARVSLPGLRRALPGGDLSQLRINIHLGLPASITQTALAPELFRPLLPYGQLSVTVEVGGLLTRGNSNGSDPVLIIDAVLEVGY